MAREPIDASCLISAPGRSYFPWEAEKSSRPDTAAECVASTRMPGIRSFAAPRR